MSIKHQRSQDAKHFASVPHSFVLVCCSIAAIACLAFVPSTYAQATDEADGLEIEEIVVTGSHIQRTDYTGPQPIVVFDRTYLQATGFNDIAEFSRYVPQSHQTLNEGRASFATGIPEASQFNLRGLGVDSTLTLVNGLRVAPYGQSMWGDPFVDISAIPMSAVERIEILKDGASAIYGSDAVAGVVNIILRKDYVGTEVTGGYQVTSRNDNAQWNTDLVHGGQRGAFHYMFSFSYEDRDPLYNRDRAHSADMDFSSIGGYNFRSRTSSPPTVLNYDTFSLHADPACGTDPLLTVVEPDPDFPGESVCRFNYNQYDMMFVERKRMGLSLRAGYEFGNGAHLFGDAFFGENDSYYEQAPTPIAGAWLPTVLGRPVVQADHPNNPYGAPVEIFYRPLDTGPRQFDKTARQDRVVVGLEGNMGDWNVRASVLNSRNRYEENLLKGVLIQEFQDALLGFGGPNQDQYYNPFGWMPENDPAVIEGFMTTAKETGETTEQSAEITLDREFGNLWGGPVGLAIGAQWRKQELEEWADENLVQQRIAGGEADFLISYADRNITAAYAEVKLPLRDTLELQLAGRYEDYSDFGHTTNPKVAVHWQMFEQLAVRASRGTSFHAPDFNDLYQNPVQYLEFFIDTPRCEVTGLAADCDYELYDVLDQGNPDLEPETGESWFAGLEWTPPYLAAFAASLDYWSYEYDDRISWIWGQFALNNLPVDTPLIERFPQTPEEAAAGIPGRIRLVHVVPANLAQHETSGFDVAIAYAWDATSISKVDLRLDYTYTDSWDATLPGANDYVEYSMAGKYWDGPLPRHRGNLTLNLERGRHDFNSTIRYAGRYRNRMEFMPVDGMPSDIPFIVDDHTTFDFQYAVEPERIEGARLRIGCQNCFDVDPPFTHDVFGEDIHDRRGLIWYANWSQSFSRD